MIVYLIGVNHLDPLARPGLRQCLKGFAKDHPDLPGFVGVEYDYSIFLTIVAQRPRFGQLVREKWPSMPQQDVLTLQNSLAYEGDAHTEIYPGVPTLWLDEGRTVPNAVIASFADDRLSVYGSHAGAESPPSLDRIRRGILKVANPASLNPERSRAFALLVLEAIRTSNPSWAIVITGSAHTDLDTLDSMAALLAADGVTCSPMRL